MISNWSRVPTGNTEKIKGVIAAEWKAADEETQREVIRQFKECFRQEYLDKHQGKGLKNYSCFLNQDGHHVFHFSEWMDKACLDSFVHNDHVFSASRFQQNLLVTTLWKNVYYPYQLYKEKGQAVSDTGLIVFVKQYFEKQGQAKEWIDKILNTMEKEGHHEGLIQNTYYLNQDGTALLNYALWDNEENYNAFLQHLLPETKKDWRGVEDFKGWLSKKGVIRKHNKFMNIYQQSDD